MSYTPKEWEEAKRIVNDIAEDIDNGESRKKLRRALSVYADRLEEVLQTRQTSATKAVLARLNETNRT